MKAVSTINTYGASDGSRYTNSQIEKRVRLAKAEKIEQQLDDHGYNHCEDCKNNNCKPLDCSHIISVKVAKQTGRAELCWDVDNLEILGRPHHMKVEGMTEKEREDYYLEKKFPQ